MSKKNNGFTLVEVLLSIVLLGIIAISIFPVFSNVFGSIFSAGDKTQSVYDSQGELIYSIQTDDISNPLIESFEGIEINITAGTDTYTIPVKIIRAKDTYQNPNPKSQDQEFYIYYYVYNP